MRDAVGLTVDDEQAGMIAPRHRGLGDEALRQRVVKECGGKAHVSFRREWAKTGAEHWIRTSDLLFTKQPL